MKRLTTLTFFTLTFLLSTSSFSQTQQEVVSYISGINEVNNQFINQLAEFTLNTQAGNISPKTMFDLYLNIVKEYDVSFERIKEIKTVQWDEEILPMTLDVYQVIGENLKNSKGEYESILGTTHLNNTQVLDMLFVTEKLNKIIFSLNSRRQIAELKLFNKYHITMIESVFNLKMDLINRRVKFSNEVMKIYLPPLIDLGHLLNAYNEHDATSTKIALNKSYISIQKAIKKLESLPKIEQSENLTGATMAYLIKMDEFVKGNAPSWVSFTAQNQNELDKMSKEQIENYNKAVGLANETTKKYNGLTFYLDEVNASKSAFFLLK